MSTLAVGTIKSISSAAPVFQNTSGTEKGQLVKAWVNYNGVGTVAIRDSFNVSSITDNATGNYNINFGTAMANVNYAVALSNDKSSVNNRGVGLDKDNYSTTSFRLTIEDPSQSYGGGSSRQDCTIIGAAIFGD